MIGDIAQWAIVVFVGLGLIGTWIRNGRSQSKRNQTIIDNQANILARLNDETTGLTALNEKMHTYETHCAGMSTGLSERVIAAERDIKELKHK